MGQQFGQPPGILQLSAGKVIDTGFKVFAIGIHRPDHQLISEHKVEIDPFRGDGMVTVASRDAGQQRCCLLPAELRGDRLANLV